MHDWIALGWSLLASRLASSGLVLVRDSEEIAGGVASVRYRLAGQSELGTLRFASTGVEPVENRPLDVGAVFVRQGASGRPAYLIPRMFVQTSGPEERLVHLWTRNIGSICNVDLLGLLAWAYGLSCPAEPPDNWSHYVAASNLGGLSLDGYVDDLVDCVATDLGARPENATTGSIVVTGDSDNASEGDIVAFLNSVGEYGGSATVLIRNVHQITPQVISAVRDGNHSLGIHPYSEVAQTDDFLRCAEELIASCTAATGERPVAFRAHRFQWHDPAVVRRSLAGLGIRLDLNLVCANGTAWLGAPTGAFVPSAIRVLSEDFWIIPTVIEDEVFLYDVEYGFKYVPNARKYDPIRYVAECLDHLVLGRGLPVVVNLHPEHMASGYSHLHWAVLHWAANNRVSCLSADQLLLEQEDARGAG